MQYRTLGSTGEKLSAIGLGCMGMSYAYGPADKTENLATLERSLELGVNFWDTADIYGNGANETLLSEVLRLNRSKVFLATKFGFRYPAGVTGYQRNVEGTFVDASPEWCRQAVEASLKRLKIETIDLYYAHRVDPKIPIEETIGAMATLVKEGKVRYIGLSEASASSIRRAHKEHPIAALQSEYSLLTRDIETEILPVLRELGIALVPFSPLARGLITNTVDNTSLSDDDYRKKLPRYRGKNWDNNRQLAGEFAFLAEQKELTPAQLALAWVLAQGNDIIPIPGTKRKKYLEENVKAVDVTISTDESDKIEALLKKYPEIGERYDPSRAAQTGK